MAELGKNVQFFNLSLPSSDQLMANTEVLNQIRELNSGALLDLSCEEYSKESLFNYCCLSENRYPNLVQPLPSTAQSGCLNELSTIHTLNSINMTESKRPKLIQSIPSRSANDFSTVSGEELNSNMSSKPTKNLRRRKRTINDCGNSERDKSNEVIHVRARRGQATDSHSLAERMRREKINNKLKCLQEIVPGCHKEMGMTLMLDQIINYVHSLQSQIEYLSMELEAAFSGDGNFKTTKSHEGTRSHEIEGMERWASEQYGEYNCFNMTWPQ